MADLCLAFRVSRNLHDGGATVLVFSVVVDLGSTAPVSRRPADPTAFDAMTITNLATVPIRQDTNPAATDLHCVVRTGSQARGDGST